MEQIPEADHQLNFEPMLWPVRIGDGGTREILDQLPVDDHALNFQPTMVEVDIAKRIQRAQF